MTLDLSNAEKKEVIACCDNYYDDEVPGASAFLLKIKAKLKRDEPLEQEELKILYSCLDRDVHDMEAQANNAKSCRLLEEAQIKIKALIIKD